MKKVSSKIFWFFLYFVLFIYKPFDSEAQQNKLPAKPDVQATKSSKNPNLGNLNTRDYKYYFIGYYNKQYWSYIAPNNTPYYPIIDVRTFKPINVWFQSADKGRLMPDSSILRVLHDRYDHSGRIASMTPKGAINYFSMGMIQDGDRSFNIQLSPNSKYGIFFKNNDIWRADFDYKSGKFSNPRQVTKLGLFTDEGVWNWYGNAIGVSNYLINLADGVVIDLTEKYYFNVVEYMKGHSSDKHYTSPNNRYTKIATNTAGGSKINIFDFQDFKFTQLAFTMDQSQIFWWISDNSFILNVIKNDPKGNDGHSTIVLNGNLQGSFEIKQIKGISDIMEIFSNWPMYDIHPSPNLKYFLFNEARSYENTKKIYALNVNTFEKKLLDFLWPSIPNSGNLDFTKSVHWVDDTHIVFSQYNGQVSINDQGTYLLNVETGEKKKLTPYTLSTDMRLSSVVSLPQANTILFNANGFLFKCAIDGSAVEQITKEASEITVVDTFVDTFK